MFGKYRKFIKGVDEKSLEIDNKVSDYGPAAQSTFVGASVTIEGKVLSHEDIVIAGEVQGVFMAENHHVHIAKSGVVTADITAKIVSIEGSVTGNVMGLESVIIAASSVVHGNVECPRVSLEDGAKFKGSIEMNPSESAQSVLPIFSVPNAKVHRSLKESVQTATTDL
jgi:cytoskeletal protein CcmA (bactofilin family)